MTSDVKLIEEFLALARNRDCDVCNGDCSAANPPVIECPVRALLDAKAALRRLSTTLLSVTRERDSQRVALEVVRNRLHAANRPKMRDALRLELRDYIDTLLAEGATPNAAGAQQHVEYDEGTRFAEEDMRRERAYRDGAQQQHGEEGQ